MWVMFASITTVVTTVGTTITPHLLNSTSTVPAVSNKSIAMDTTVTTPNSDNITENPWLFTTVEPGATGTVIIRDGYWYWSSLYYFYLILLLFLCSGLILAGISRNKRLTAEQRARLRAQGNGTTCVTPNEPASNGTAISTLDNPPTYENAMANYIDAKQQLRAMEEGAAMAMTASTTTIETCITEVAASRTDLSANTAGVTNISNEGPRPALQ